MKYKDKIFFNQNGFSIASVVIAMSIMSVITLGVTTLIQNSMKSVTYIEDKLSAINLQNELNMDFSDSRVCKNTLKNLKVVSEGEDQVVPAIKSSNDRIVYKAPTTYDRLNIDRILLENVNVAAPNTTGRMNLSLNLKRQREGVADLKPVTVPLSVVTDGTGRIASCVALGSEEDGNNPAKRCASAPGNGLGAGSKNNLGSSATIAEAGHLFLHNTTEEARKAASASDSAIDNVIYIPKCSEIPNANCPVREGSIHAVTTGQSGSEYGTSTVSYLCTDGRWLRL